MNHYNFCSIKRNNCSLWEPSFFRRPNFIFIKLILVSFILIIASRVLAESNYYELLGVDINATSGEIKIAYRKKAMEFHPDRKNESSSEAKFKVIKKSYEVLSNPLTRAEYDKTLDFSKDGSLNKPIVNEAEFYSSKFYPSNFVEADFLNRFKKVNNSKLNDNELDPLYTELNELTLIVNENKRDFLTESEWQFISSIFEMHNLSIDIWPIMAHLVYKIKIWPDFFWEKLETHFLQIRQGGPLNCFIGAIKNHKEWPLDFRRRVESSLKEGLVLLSENNVQKNLQIAAIDLFLNREDAPLDSIIKIIENYMSYDPRSELVRHAVYILRIDKRLISYKIDSLMVETIRNTITRKLVCVFPCVGPYAFPYTEAILKRNLLPNGIWDMFRVELQSLEDPVPLVHAILDLALKFQVPSDLVESIFNNSSARHLINNFYYPMFSQPNHWWPNELSHKTAFNQRVNNFSCKTMSCFKAKLNFIKISLSYYKESEWFVHVNYEMIKKWIQDLEFYHNEFDTEEMLKELKESIKKKRLALFPYKVSYEEKQEFFKKLDELILRVHEQNTRQSDEIIKIEKLNLPDNVENSNELNNVVEKSHLPEASTKKNWFLRGIDWLKIKSNVRKVNIDIKSCSDLFLPIENH